MLHPSPARHGLVLVLLFASTLSLLLGLSALLLVADAAPTPITWSPPSLNPTLVQGSTATSTVTFTSLDPLNNVALSLTPALKGLVTFAPAQFSRVLPQTKYTVQVTFKIPPTAKPQDYVGELALTAGKTTLPNTLKLGLHVVAAGQPTPTRAAASPTATPPVFSAKSVVTGPYNALLPFVANAGQTRSPRPLASSLAPENMGIERFWTYRQFPLTDRLTLLVNVSNGNLIAQYDELSIPARGIPLALKHTYNSGADLANVAGYDWVRSLDQHMKENLDGSVTLYDGDGTALLFTNPVSGTYTAPAGSSDQLTQAQDGSFTLLHKDQSTDIFRKNAGTNALLVSQTDRLSNGLTLSYDGSDKLTSVQSSAGPTFTLSYDGGTGKLSSVTDLANRSFAYTYSGDDLATITDPLTHTTTFTYTGHLLTGIGDPRGKATSILYDASNRVQSISIAGVTVATFSYDTNSTTFTDGNSHATTYTLNATGQVRRPSMPQAARPATATMRTTT